MTAKTAVASAPVEEKKLTPEQEAMRWASIDMQIDHHGEKIILPDVPGRMPIPEAIKSLKRIEDMRNKEFEINEPIQCHFFDGLVALAKALKEKYGFVATDDGTVQTFFGKMKVPPRLIHVRTGPGDTDFLQVPFGTFSFPGIEASIETKMGESKGIPVVRLVGTVKQKDKAIVMEVIHLAQQIAKRESIYRGNSVVIKRDEKGGNINLNEPLDFFDAHAGKEVPIFNRDTEALIETTVMAPLAHSATCRSMSIPLKRGVLLEGPYGTGKTLLARQVARVANDNGWAFILVTAATALKYALNFAKMYQPCVVFAEDIDRIAGDRNEGANDLINEIDGVVGKNDEIITVLTTNFADRIDKAFLRPGRLDAVISLRAPDAEAVERLIRAYAGDLLLESEDLSKVKKTLAGNIPATIREVVERSKLAMLTSGRKSITTDDLDVSALGMKNHLDLIERAAEGVRTLDPITTAIQRVMIKTMVDHFDFTDQLDQVDDD